MQLFIVPMVMGLTGDIHDPCSIAPVTNDLRGICTFLGHPSYLDNLVNLI